VIANIVADVRYGARNVFSRPGFAVVIVLTLALGIGVNVAIFSLFQQILLRPLPVAEPDRLVNLSSPGPKLDPAAGRGWFAATVSGGPDTAFSYPLFRDLEREQQPFVGIAAYNIFEASLSTGAEARSGTAVHVSGSYFSVLGLRPALGRLLGADDDRVDGQAESAVLSYAYWLREFAGDAQVIGRRLIVNGTPLSIVGVAPAGFHGTTIGARPSVFVPITLRVDAANQVGEQGASDDAYRNRGAHWLRMFARLAPGVSREEAAVAINPLYRAILTEIEVPLWEERTAEQLDEFRARSLVLEPGARGQSSLLAPARGRLAMLFAVTGAVLLLCCANVAGLMLVRGSARTGEMAVRVSMGASRARLASLLVAESLLLALPAALLSLPIALLALQGVASGMLGIPTAAFAADVNLGAAFAAIGVAVVAALAAGLLPIRTLTRTEPGKTLQAYGSRQTSSRGVARFRAALATVQIALAMALVAMTAVFAQSLANIARVDLGLDVDSVIAFSVSPQTIGYAQDASARLFDRLDEELAAIPGVASAASSMYPLLSGGEPGWVIRVVEGADVGEPVVPFNVVSDGFFRTLGIDLLAGRDFTAADTAGAPAVAVVNRRFVERFGLDGAGLGARFSPSPRVPPLEIVGLVADTKYGNVTDDIGPQVFLARGQSAFRAGLATFYVRTAQAPAAVMNAIRETVARVDPAVPITNLRSMRMQVRENLAMERFVAGASTAFAVLATLLAGLGLYGVLAYAVAQRAREIGLRVALGAPARRIRALVLRQVAAMAAIGIAVGAAAAWMLGGAARSLLFGIEAGNPLALAAAGAVLAAVALVAAYFPARRASRVDPMSVLRCE
jgi:putative ABC transport system permease protein